MFRTLCHVLMLAALAWPAVASADSTSLLAQAQAANPVRYAFAVGKNAEIRNTTDNRSFTVWWQPASTATPKGVIVALHGHDSYATDEMYLWQPYAEKYGYAVLALQWWFGSGEATSDYYTPDEMYPLLSTLLTEKGIAAGTVLFVGYSRGSANSYAVTARDAAGTGRRHFGLVLSNSGGATAGYPPNQQIDAGAYGSTPFAGVKWAMYCGELDPDPTINGCPAMNAAKAWVTQYGANVVLFIDDPTGGHGGFMTNSANVETALATFATVLATPAAAPTCTLSASATTLSAGSASTLMASCNPAATAYAWTGGTCAGTSAAGCTVTPGATTTYTVSGSNAAGWGAAASVTISVSDKTAPTVPAALKATAIGSSQVSLGWTGASDNVGVAGYRVYRNGVLVGSPSAAAYVDNSLMPSTAYTYAVAACDAAGNCSTLSTSLKVTTAALVMVPTCTVSASSGTVSPGGSSILTARCTPVATTYAWAGGSCAGSTGGSCTVTPTATTTYTVIGSNAGGAGSAAAVTVTVADTTAPSTPAAPTATVIGSTQVQLSWSGATDNVAVTGYTVYRGGVLVGTTASAGYADGGLKAATPYSYTVAACDAAGNCSAPSAAVSITTAAASNVLANAEADCLFDWGEDHYPTALSPRRPASLSAAPYYYRRYTGTNSYLGVSSADNRLYYLDASGRTADLGLAATWSAQAGCR